MTDYFQILSFYKKLKYNFNESLLNRIKRRFNLEGNRFEVLRYLDSIVRSHKFDDRTA